MKKKSPFRAGRRATRSGPRQQRPSQNVSPTRPPELTSALSQALALHQTGRFAEAEKNYLQILKAQPNHFDSLHLLGVIYHQRGNHAEAVRQIDVALKRNPNAASALSNRGNALQELKQFDEALASYDKAIALKPDYAEVFNNRGNALKKLKRLDEALASYDHALALRPDYADALNDRGAILQELKRLDEALASYDRALAVRPDYTEALCNRGVVLRELKRRDEALASYDQALALRPDYAEALNNRGNCLKEMNRFDEALESCDRALAVRSDYADALNNRGNILNELKRFDEALASCDRALIVRPDYAEALSNRGIALQELNRVDEALASYDRALALKPDYAEALSNRGVTLQKLKRFDEALASYNRALAVRPDYAEAHWNEALLRLLSGDFNRGWPKYEWRWKTDSFTSPRRNFPQPLWLGEEAIAGRAILLHSEQGFGDTIQFCRYVPMVAAGGAHVILEVDRSLHELMIDLPGAAQIVSRGDKLPIFDLHCPLLSLPLVFRTRFETIPADIPYLFVPKAYSEKWKQRLSKSAAIRVGINWAGNANFGGDRNRSIGLSRLLPLLSSRDVQFFSIQKDLRAGDSEILQNNSQITHLGEEIETFSDTAAIISLMDLIISSDTSVVHLAGALGKPVWILLQSVPDWRWLLDRDDSPWYPTARLFRQPKTGEWGGLVAHVHEALLNFVASRG
jgi:tetratricopeptide (TPR) repeat protein